MASLANVEHRNQDATVYVGNLDPLCSNKVLTELFSQVGRVKSIYMPQDKLTTQHHGYGFIEFQDVLDAEYAIQVFNMIKFYNRPLKVSKSSLHNSKIELWNKDVGANLFIGNLDPLDVDEHLLYDTFSSFGTLVKQPKIMREEETTTSNGTTIGDSKGFGFVSFDNFESSDTAMECMHGQYLCNRQIVVQYAFKKDNVNGITNNSNSNNAHERHGSRAERMLAAQRLSSEEAMNTNKRKAHPASWMKFRTHENGQTNSNIRQPGMNQMTMMGGGGMGNRGGPRGGNNHHHGAGGGMMPLPPPPPRPPPMMMGHSNMGGGNRGGGGPPGNYGPSGGGGGTTNTGVGSPGPSSLSPSSAGRGRGRGMSMTQPAWMTQGVGAGGVGSGTSGNGPVGMPPPPPPPPPMMQQQQQQSSMPPPPPPPPVPPMR
mmetsp:Transcript_43417/g.48634  ORF Transcript_43417/g.48634 Transcript_43417/m.48634 type:complete len:428 (-) Transcript_43417:191-1474(-)